MRRVDDLEARVRGYIAGLQQFADPLCGAFGDPGIDVASRDFGRAEEVHALQPRGVERFERRGECRDHLQGVVEPQRLRTVQFAAAEGGELLAQRSERSVCVGERPRGQMQNPTHLGSRFAARAFGRHHQDRRDRPGRQEQVAVLPGRQLLVEVDRELIRR